MHISPSDHCADHCISWLLSDSGKPEFRVTCGHTHTIKCDQCEPLNEIEGMFSAALEKDEKNHDEKSMNLASAFEQIREWKRHIVRTINQDQSRIDLLKNLESHQVVLVMDWAMKFLPRKVCLYTEVQCKK